MTTKPSVGKGRKICILKNCLRIGKIKTRLGYFCTEAHRRQVQENIFLFLNISKL